MWKKCIKQTPENTSLLAVKDHHLLRVFWIIILQKLSCKELYSLLISAIDHQPTSAETTLHVFHKCSVAKILWNQLLLFFETDLDFPDLTPQTALFGFINESDNNLNILQNHILLIFKLYIYQSRERGVLNLNGLIKNVTKVKILERKIASVCEKKTIQFNNKWKSTDLKITV